MDERELNKHIEKLIEDQNRRTLKQFEGYSPEEMHHLLYSCFSAESPVKLNRLEEEVYLNIPMLRQVKYLAEIIAESGELQLTKTGGLPVKVVADLYGQGFLKDEEIERGLYKLYKESSSITVQLTRILIEITGLAHKRKGKLKLSAKSSKVLSSNELLLHLLLETFINKFNWAYFDGYQENGIGSVGIGYTLAMLSKYGKDSRPDHFYAQKYFTAFPALMENLEPKFGTPEQYASACYSIRTFSRFLVFFGLIDIHSNEDRYMAPRSISTTELFDQLIFCALPGTPTK